METFEQKAQDVFSEIVINKSFVHQAGFGSRSIPTYVKEWIVSYYLGGEDKLNDLIREKIGNFIQKNLPDKSQKETIKNMMFEQREVKLLDNYSVVVNLDKGDRYLNIPFLDETGAFSMPQIIDDNKMLLSSGLWGVGTLYYIPKSEDNKKGQIWMRGFKPFQLANTDIDYFCQSRSHFTTLEWINLIVSTMGFNHHIYSERQKILLISRLIPMVEPRYNLVELAPKGTGKSFVFDNMSRYVAVRSGSVTPAVLFYNDARKTPGLITRYDCVVIDEAQKVKGDSSGDLTALLKSYLEAGHFARGKSGDINAEAGLVMLANIDLDQNKRPLFENYGLLRIFPNFLKETAFIDRFSGLLPGWDLPRISKDTPSKSIGLKGDFFSEILHCLRIDLRYRNYAKQNMELTDCDDMRDNKGVEAGASGLLKILFPDLNPSEEDFYRYCVNPALELRQRVRDELCKMDPEYLAVTFKSKIPDTYQQNHRLAVYVDPRAIENLPEMVVIEKSGIDEEAIEFGTDREPEELVEIETPVVTSISEELLSKTVTIKEGETGYSYENLFGPYLKGARIVHLVDPYIRMEYQIKNLLLFIKSLDTTNGSVELKLSTSAEDDYQKSVSASKFKDLADGLSQHGIIFTYEFDPNIHDRSIRLDNGWTIYTGRGIDIFQKPDTKYELSEVEPSKRKCRETEIVFFKTEDKK
jgi:ATP-dependent Lon protease